MSLVVPPYPPVRYPKAEPEVSASLRRAPENGGEPADYDAFGLIQYHYLADQQKTDGDYGLYRVDLAPQAGGPGPHYHRAHIPKTAAERSCRPLGADGALRRQRLGRRRSG